MRGSKDIRGGCGEQCISVYIGDERGIGLGFGFGLEASGFWSLGHVLMSTRQTHVRVSKLYGDQGIGTNFG